VSSWESQLQFFEKALEKLGRLDVVIANAGIGGYEEFNEYEDRTWTSLALLENMLN
jgi:NAD(P)-dependent dehydrogenase (short-subunit alcohol dehydrogenase family)